MSKINQYLTTKEGRGEYKNVTKLVLRAASSAAIEKQANEQRKRYVGREDGRHIKYMDDKIHFKKDELEENQRGYYTRKVLLQEQNISAYPLGKCDLYQYSID